jgi:N utilization substance protein B
MTCSFKNTSILKSRRKAREWVLKALYAYEMSRNSLDLVIQQRMPENISAYNLDFALELLRLTVEKSDWIDEIIKRHVEKWELARIATLDRIILRQSICEIFFFKDIPPKVTINEAIEIARKYSTAKSDKFVNGVLDAVLHHEVEKGDFPALDAEIQQKTI